MNADLLRQRRNLLLVCGLLIVFDFAGVSIAKVSILGTELIVGNPNVLLVVAWFLWGYFFLRYYQYLREESDLKIVSDFTNHLEVIAIEHDKLKHPEDERHRQFGIERNGMFSWKYELLFYNYDSSKFEADPTRAVSTSLAAFWASKSILYVVAHTPRFTDHIAPILLAIITPLVNIYTNYA